MCVILWLYVYCEIWYDGKHVPCITMGRCEHLPFLLVSNICSSSSRRHEKWKPRSGGTFGYCWRCLPYGWHGLCRALFSLFHTLILSQGYVFISYSFFHLANWISFGPIRPSSTGRSSSIGSTYHDHMRIIGYMAIIVITLKVYESPPSSTRTGMGTRNTMQGSGMLIDGNTTQDHGAGTSVLFTTHVR
jgi:hypothetical protein